MSVDLNYNGHDFDNEENICTKCNVKMWHMEMMNIYINDYINLTCDEIIIKGIIE